MNEFMVEFAFHFTIKPRDIDGLYVDEIEAFVESIRHIRKEESKL